MREGNVAMNTELQRVLEQANGYNLIPISRTILADTETPIRIFQHFYEEKRAFLLESVEGGAKWARYSFIGMDPFMVISAKNGSLSIEQGDQRVVTPLTEKPLAFLKRYLGQFKSAPSADLPPFTGGAIGFFGYDLLQYYEKLPRHREDDLKMDDIQFMFCDLVIVFDHFKQNIQVVGNVHVPVEDASVDAITDAYEMTISRINATLEKISRPLHLPMLSSAALPTEVDLGTIQSNVTKEQFIANVEKSKEYIKAGDIFQVVLSQRFHVETDVNPLHVYRVLRTMNPSPYMYYLKLDDEVIVGTSPEALVKVANGRVETRPIAGTRPRGKTPEEDVALERELLADMKECAEHLMLVDLGRNDIGRVAKYGSVRCDSYMEIERYSHVMHIVSNVSGELAEDKDFFDAFISCMPAGTVSGAPKLRAMEVIAELENEARGAYAGAIGYLGFAGAMDACITIRTIIFKNGKAYVQAGAGIVADSVPENEYMETVNKGMSSLKAIRVAEAAFRTLTK